MESILEQSLYYAIRENDLVLLKELCLLKVDLNKPILNKYVQRIGKRDVYELPLEMVNDKLYRNQFCSLQPKIIELLLENGADPNAFEINEQYGKNTCFCSFARLFRERIELKDIRNYMQIFCAYVTHGVNINIPDCDGQTPLYLLGTYIYHASFHAPVIHIDLHASCLALLRKMFCNLILLGANLKQEEMNLWKVLLNSFPNNCGFENSIQFLRQTFEDLPCMFVLYCFERKGGFFIFFA